MENSRKKLWVCLFCVVTTAVAVGFIYYFMDVRNAGNLSDGVLITGMRNRWGKVWQ